MKLIDLHCDTLFQLMENEEFHLLENEKLHIDLQRLKKADSLLQVFAMFDYKEFTNYEFEKYMSFVDRSLKILDNCREDINIVRKYDDIKKDKQNILLSAEDIGSTKGERENIKNLYDLGFRMMGLTWNYENEIGYDNTYNDNIGNGLKKKGKEAVEYLNELGVIIDTSHLNDAGFYDVCDISKKPFIASHSNSRTLMDTSRNLSDDMIRKIADKGGVVGINFFSKFLDGSDLSKEGDIIKHIKYMINVGGEDIVCFGSDFDGIDCEIEIKDVTGFNKLYKALEKENIPYRVIEKIYYKNALKLFREIL